MSSWCRSLHKNCQIGTQSWSSSTRNCSSNIRLTVSTLRSSLTCRPRSGVRAWQNASCGMATYPSSWGCLAVLNGWSPWSMGTLIREIFPSWRSPIDSSWSVVGQGMQQEPDSWDEASLMRLSALMRSRLSRSSSACEKRALRSSLCRASSSCEPAFLSSGDRWIRHHWSPHSCIEKRTMKGMSSRKLILRICIEGM